MAPTSLGDLEQLALLAVLQLAEDAYAVSVRDEIERRTGRSVSRGAMYVTLDRLETKGFVSSRLGAPTAARGGKAKRVFVVETTGRAVLQKSLQNVRAMSDGLNLIPGWEGSAP